MLAHLRANLWLLVLTVVLCSVLYPLVILGIGQTLFHDKAEGSLLTDAEGRPVGSQLIAQPFTADEYFQPRPSATSPAYNAAASGCSNLAGNNYALRDRVARQLGPIVMKYVYLNGVKVTQPVAGDIEGWFQNDKFKDPSGKEKSGIVAQWASQHPSIAQGWLHDWVKTAKLNADYVADLEKNIPDDVAEWKKDNTFDPNKPEDLAAGVAGPLFARFSKDHPGRFPGVAEYEKDGKTPKRLGPVEKGSDIQSLFFDMWRQEHPQVELEPVPADMVMTSGSGLDPDITLANAQWQLDHRVAAAWASKPGAAKEKVLHDQIEQLLRAKSHAPLGGLVGVPLVNVLEVNLALRDLFPAKTAEAGK
jgi:K+-transporting ATPase ATPase C chain